MGVKMENAFDIIPASDQAKMISDQVDVINKLRGQLQNCVNHLEGVRRRYYSERVRHDECIESANKALYETLIQ